MIQKAISRQKKDYFLTPPRSMDEMPLCLAYQSLEFMPVKWLKATQLTI